MATTRYANSLSEHVTLLRSHGSAGLAGWHLTSPATCSQKQLEHHAKRVYERDLHGFCYILTSLSLSLSYKAPNATLKHPLLVVQLYVPAESHRIFIELGTTDVIQSRPNSPKFSTKRRIFLSNRTKLPKSTPLHSNLPITDCLPRGQWTSLLIDLASITDALYKTCKYRSLDFVSIQGDNIKLRCVYTTSMFTWTTPDSSDPRYCDLQASVPSQLAFPFTMQCPWVVYTGMTCALAKPNLAHRPHTPSRYGIKSPIHHPVRPATLPQLPKPSSLQPLPRSRIPVPSTQFSLGNLKRPTTGPPRITTPATRLAAPLKIPAARFPPKPAPVIRNRMTCPTHLDTADPLDMEVSNVISHALQKANINDHPNVDVPPATDPSVTEPADATGSDDSFVELTYDTSIGAYVDQLSGQCFQIDSY